MGGDAATRGGPARIRWAAWLGFGVAYLTLALGADWLTNQSSQFSTFWPAAGLYVGVLLLFDRRTWPGFVAAATVGGLIASAVLGRRPVYAISGAVADTVEAVLAALLVRRALGGRPRMWRILDLLAVVFLGAGIAAAAAATIGGATVSLVQKVSFAQASLDWWVGDALGILVVAPLVLAWGSRDATEPSPVQERAAEFGALIFATLVVAWTVFHDAPSGVLRQEYLVLPLFVWAALRFGPRGATAASAVLATAGAWATAWAFHLAGGQGLAPDSPRIQIYLGLATATALVLAAEVAGRARTERKLRLARYALDQGAEATLVCDAGGAIVLASEAAGRLLGRSTTELVGQDVVALDRSLAAMAGGNGLASLSSRGDLRYETVLEDSTGRRSPAEVHLAFITYERSRFLAWSARDLSERRRIEEDQRLAAVGTLASGVAHEINNPLTYVTSSLAFLQEALERMRGVHPEVPEAEEAAAEAVLGARRVRDIVRDLRFVARPPDGRLIEIDPVQEIRSALNLAQAEIQRRATLELELEPCPAVMAGQGQIGQVMVQLLLNAAQSIPPGPAGGHTVRVRSRRGGDGHALIAVADDGIGIPPEARARIFEPFFSTRPVGGGTGLGLSVCHGIVTALGGTIDVESEPGRGTTVTVRLPPASATAPPG
jgi:PAS domain S-box-containing protein